MSQYVLILGAKSDIAKALAHEYAKNGYALYLAARDTEALKPEVSDLAIRYQVKVSEYAFDAAGSYDTHASFYRSLVPVPDIVICVFGVMFPQEEVQKNWNLAHQTISVNYTGAVSIIGNCGGGDGKKRKRNNYRNQFRRREQGTRE